MHTDLPIYKKLSELRRSAHAILDADASGLSIFQAMQVGQMARRSANEIGRVIDGPVFDKD